jgi:DNA polymerase III epsilon subunit-like protein
MSNSNIVIVFDTETTGFSPIKNEIVQLSYILYDIQNQNVIYSTQQVDDIVKINGEIPKQTSDVHGITKDMTLNKRPIKEHIDKFIHYCNQSDKFVGHNISFDIKMIVGQINKIIEFSSPEEVEKYKIFLNRFAMVGKDLPQEAYCTMEESKSVCAEIRGTKKLKKEKLMEVHKLLFKQDVGGQLHNALVDISVTLRVFLKLTMDIDICLSINQLNTNVTNVSNNNEICNLINPIIINQPIQNVEYNGELITEFTILQGDGGIEEQKIMVQTIANKMATNMVNSIQKKAITNVMNKIAPDESNFTSITICKAIIKSGNRRNEFCGRPTCLNDFCGYHKPKEKSNVYVKPSIKPETKFASTYVTNLFKNASKKNKKIVPIGGKKNRKTRKTRKTKKNRKTKKTNQFKDILTRVTKKLL